MSNDLVIWASQDVTLPVAGTANKIKPDPQLSNIGWDKGQKPSAQEFNFILNQVTSTLVKVNKYGAPLIGELIFWPLQQMPQEIWPDCGMVFIPYIGQAFDGVRYPLLKQIHPSGVLPADMRGEFPRGWDNQRGVDNGRVIMSQQQELIKNHSHIASRVGSPGSYQEKKLTNLMFEVNTAATVPTEMTIKVQGNFPGGSTGFYGGTNASQSLVLDFNDGSLGTETRPRNIAWNMIVRAA